MRKNVSKLLCLLMVVLAIFCLQTAVFAEETEAPVANYQILGEMGSSDEDGNLLISTNGKEMILEADFGANSLDALAWDVLSGKDVLSVEKRDGFEGHAIAKPLANGEAVVAAYLEDGSQVLATKKIKVSNQTPAAAATSFTLNCSAEGNGKVYRITDDETISLGTSYIRSHVSGTVMKLVAEEGTHPFKYWVVRRGDDNIIATTDKTFEFVLAQDMTVVAVFDKTDATKPSTNFTFLYERIIAANAYLTNKKEMDEPVAPYQRNKGFKEWTSAQVDVATVLEDNKLTVGELTQATTFEATYTQKDTAIEITVIGGNGSGTYAYGAPVTATVTETEKFLFWSKDGAPVSYDRTYQFSAMQDCTVCAVYGDAVTTDGINMVMQTPVVEGDMIAFTFERYVPANYDFVTSGFIVSNANDKVLMEAVSYRDGVRTQLTKSLAKENGTYYARGYVVYMDNGEVKTIYTEPQKIVIE